jgi:hypothetical protein
MTMKKILAKIFLMFLKYAVVLVNQYHAYRLKDYSTAITDVRDCMPASGQNRYAIFVYYEPDGRFSKSAQNILSELRKQSVDVLLMCNHQLSREQDEAISQLVHKVVTRENQGFDFGAYKDGVRYLKESKIQIEKLLFLNDSIYYFSTGLDVFVEGLLQSEDAIAAFENWEVPHSYHLQSFALSVNGQVFSSEKFTSFWRDYRPVSNRLHAIERGEKQLSKAILSTAGSVQVLYEIKDILDDFDSIRPDGVDRFLSLPLINRKTAVSKSESAQKGNFSAMILNTDEGEDFTKFIVANSIGIGPFSPIHSGAYYFAKLKCPVAKKDLVYRAAFDFWEVSEIFRDVFSNDEVDEFLSILRKKGTLYSLSFPKRMLANIGAL